MCKCTLWINGEPEIRDRDVGYILKLDTGEEIFGLFDAQLGYFIDVKRFTKKEGLMRVEGKVMSHRDPTKSEWEVYSQRLLEMIKD